MHRYDDWPKWQKKATPPNSTMLEIKLIASRKGYGRILMAFAFFRNLHKGWRAAVLEVMGADGNERAINMYKEFGFERQKAYDTDAGPTVQMRNKWGSFSNRDGLHHRFF
jgi:GNAT superfamily N-acetyltransferase